MLLLKAELGVAHLDCGLHRSAGLVELPLLGLYADNCKPMGHPYCKLRLAVAIQPMQDPAGYWASIDRGAILGSIGGPVRLHLGLGPESHGARADYHPPVPTLYHHGMQPQGRAL